MASSSAAFAAPKYTAASNRIRLDIAHLLIARNLSSKLSFPPGWHHLLSFSYLMTVETLNPSPRPSPEERGVVDLIHCGELGKDQQCEVLSLHIRYAHGRNCKKGHFQRQGVVVMKAAYAFAADNRYVLLAKPHINDVSDTAFWIAHHRAVESARIDALFRDPFAGRLAGEHGRKDCSPSLKSMDGVQRKPLPR